MKTASVDSAQERQLEAEFSSERALPNGVVRATGLDDWQRLLDLVRREGWRAEWTIEQEAGPPLSASDLFAGDLGTLKVWPVESLQVNFFAVEPISIAFDLDSKEMLDVGIDVVVAFVRELGKGIGKVVELSHEGDDTLVFLRYHPGEDKFDM